MVSIDERVPAASAGSIGSLSIDLLCQINARSGPGREKPESNSFIEWSGSWDSNPRRPAWEIEHRLEIKNLASMGLIADDPKLLILRGQILGVC